MSGSSDQPTRDDVAAMEAATWFAKRASTTSADDADDFHAWLSADPANRDAYAAAENIWSDLDKIFEESDFEKSDKAYAPIQHVPAAKPRRAPQWAAALAVCVALFSATLLFLRSGNETIETSVGVQQTAKLDDGTLVTLNTATRLNVRYGEDERTVRFDRGEALFEVAHDSSRPFVVSVKNHRVRALGTSFVIRSDAKKAWVALIEGSVRVTEGTGAAMVLQPGERLTLSGDEPNLDQPELGALTAWRHGELVFDRTPLSEAIFEINRYTDRPIILRDAEARKRHITGRFRVDRSEKFAESVATLYGLEVVRRADSIELRRAR